MVQSLDPELLRTLVTFAETGSLASAAEVVGRVPSALTAQMRRLEASVGDVRLFEPAGRGLRLTAAGELLVERARGILAAHRDALLELSGMSVSGAVTLGITQDFADSQHLPELLAVFARTHPLVRLDLKIGRSIKLADQLDNGRLDLAMGSRIFGGTGSRELAVRREPMMWLGSARLLAAPVKNVLPIALLEPKCVFREAALRALEAQGRRYRIAASSASLSGVRAAVRAGVAVTVRTERWARESGDLVDAAEALDLPALPAAEYVLQIKRDPTPAAERLATVLADGFF